MLGKLAPALAIDVDPPDRVPVEIGGPVELLLFLGFGLLGGEGEGGGAGEEGESAGKDPVNHGYK